MDDSSNFPAHPHADEPLSPDKSKDNPRTGDEGTAPVASRTGVPPAVTNVLAIGGSPFAAGFFLTLGGLAAFAVGTAFTNLSTITIYVAFALFVALGLDPIVRSLGRHKVTRVWGIVIVYSGFAVVMGGVLLLIVPAVVTQITQFIADLPKTITAFQKSDVYLWLLANFGDQVGTVVNEAETFLKDPAHIATLGGGLLKVGTSVATTMSGLIIVLVLSLYFLASLPAMKVAFNRLVPARARPKVAAMTDQITDSIGGYLMGMVILAFSNATVALILHLVLGLPFALLMALMAFFITLIPLVGSVIYWALATVIALFAGWLPALLFAAIYFIYIQLEAYILTPRVMNRAISVPGALVVIGALVGGTLLGLLGALIAIPVMASILLILKQVIIPRQDAKL